MPYRRRQDGINAGDRQDERESWRIIASMMGIIGILPMGGYKMYLLGILATLLIAIRALHLYDWLPVPPIDPANRNRGFNSFTDEEAYRDLRFHVYDLPKILRLLRIPVVLRVDNSKYVILILFIFVFHISFYTYISLHTYHYIYIPGTDCSGEYGLCLLLYRLHYPNTLAMLQCIFGRDYSQLSRIITAMKELVFRLHG